jgi:hypothetical protein
MRGILKSSGNTSEPSPIFSQGYLYNLDVQMATDHARLDSVKKYAKVELSARKAILDRKLIRFPQAGTDLQQKTSK